MVHPGVAWGNAASGLRLGDQHVGRRLDQLIRRFRENGRGAGFWLSIFPHTPHPYLGRISTLMRRFGLGVLAHLASQRPRRAWEFAATCAGVPIGVATVCLGPRVAGVLDVGVLPEHRGRGVGSALVQHLCAFAREHGMIGLTLIATGMGERRYRRVGFEEVCRMSSWYSRLGKHPLRRTRKGPP